MPPKEVETSSKDSKGVETHDEALVKEEELTNVVQTGSCLEGNTQEIKKGKKKEVNEEVEQEEGQKVEEPEKDLKLDDPKGTTEEDLEKKTNIAETEKTVDEKEVTPPLPVRRRTNQLEEKEEKKPVENPILIQLKEAFPNVEEKYVKAVIIASGGALDPAFNALLYISDPSSGNDIELPTKPVVQNAPDLPQRRKQTQLEQDEMLARQLHEQFNKNRHQQQGDRHSRRQISATEREARRERIRERRRRNQEPLSPEEERELYGEEDSWAQFMEKELPELKEKANRSIQETATKLNGWISGFRKNLVGEYSASDNRGERDIYDDNAYEQRISEQNKEDAPKKPERHRFNSFGAQAGEESLETHGITLQNDDKDDDFDDEDDVPPQLPPKRSSDGKPIEEKIVAETTYIDTPDASTRKKWQPVPPVPLSATPTKVVATPGEKKSNKNADDDEFLINSDDEM